jgi:hypothetical protein
MYFQGISFNNLNVFNTASSASFACVTPFISHVFMPITGLFNCRPKAISESVPYCPSIAIRASAVFAMIIFLAIPSPVAIGMSINSLAVLLSSPGRIPIVVPLLSSELIQLKYSL